MFSAGLWRCYGSSRMIRPMEPVDWQAVRTIYEEGIATGNATFETGAPSWEVWSARHHPFARVVAVENNVVVGWAALSPVSVRPVYAGVAEVSVYVGARYRGQGIGAELMQAIIQTSEDNGVWTLQAGIFPENHASIRLHLQHGFRQVGIRERIGLLAGVWRDVALFERRSGKAGGS